MWWRKDKVLVRESGLLEGFCDCHCHLLPGVDDGVQEMEETMRILEVWEALGVKEVWMTPHIMEDMPNTPEELRRRFETITKTEGFTVYRLPFTERRGGIKLHLAAEHMMDGPFLRRLEKGNVMPFNVNVNDNDNLNDNDNGNDNDNDGRKLLVETSYYTPPMNMGDIMERVMDEGYEPILAHPERYQYMGKEDYKRWKDRGVLLQLNLPALVGAYGSMVKKKAEWLLKENMYDYCGSDTHSIEQVELFLASEISRKIVNKVKSITERQVL